MTHSLKHLRYICAVHDFGSFAKAALHLNISQSSVLAAVDSAEQLMGVRIFARHKGRGVHPTAQGERFVAAARRLLNAEQDFLRETRAQEVQAAGLRIGLFEPFGSIMMVDVLERLQAEIGPIPVELLESDQPSLKRALNRGEVDLVIVYDLGPDFTGTVEHIGRASPHAMVPLDHPLATREHVSIAELAQYPIALLNLPLTVTYLMTLFEGATFRPQIRFKSRSYETLIRGVAKGFGVAVLNFWPRHPLALEQGTKRLPITDPLPAPNIITVDHYGTTRPAAVQTLIEILQAHFKTAYRDG